MMAALHDEARLYVEENQHAVARRPYMHIYYWVQTSVQ